MFRNHSQSPDQRLPAPLHKSTPLLLVHGIQGEEQRCRVEVSG
jgi:hypothetical protein